MDDPKGLARILKVLSVDTRVRIVCLLKQRDLCVNALAARLDVTQAAVSQHLRVMRDAGLVVDEKRGLFVHYRLNEKTLATWREAIDRLLDPKYQECQETKGARSCVAAAGRKKAARGRTS
ncbi:MAG: winged helix-turn-helix transcriptional regulator [Pirellulales bacterium]|nr:winged helix-turn-helix transcriptional regulator [Pirellulales bacterium]